MTRGARTPEELDTLLEDAVLLGDRRALGELFAGDAVLGLGDGRERRGRADVVRALADLGDGERTYVADTAQVVQAGDTALLIARAGSHVVQRGSDGAWRAAITLLDLHDDRSDHP